MKLFYGLVVILCLTVNASATCLKSLERESPNSRFDVKAEGNLVVDKHTGLMWQRCAYGQVWLQDKSRCQLNRDVERLYFWGEAISVAGQSDLFGFSDWRLPNKNELSSIVDRGCTGPAINENIFPDTTLAGFWTSTPARHSASYAWVVDFTVGSLSAFNMSERFSLRLVRGL